MQTASPGRLTFHLWSGLASRGPGREGREEPRYLSPCPLPASPPPACLKSRQGLWFPSGPGFAGWLLSPTPVLLAPFQPFWYLISP